MSQYVLAPVALDDIDEIAPLLCWGIVS